ncbi:unnamed protein product [Vitrella brassicaformis CCMP3155]|uniref:Uncharacterized protein n=1 Tax=Vitrella brassicaformis (strain CCMP3155) TaxID=1169540 RepID=A0A0G4GDR2_VITBC|nr:unnamed protein product [Vitrella brassicaformis CCMP3155]|eukprot:CEM27148.1 unnamed protein product [Vitrella brassicaformis CCMP3155]
MAFFYGTSPAQRDFAISVDYRRRPESPEMFEAGHDVEVRVVWTAVALLGDGSHGEETLAHVVLRAPESPHHSLVFLTDGPVNVAVGEYVLSVTFLYRQQPFMYGTVSQYRQSLDQARPGSPYGRSEHRSRE